MVLNTGKGRYRYYACSRHSKQGKTSCSGQRIRMDKLDGMTLEYLGSKIFEPRRLEQILHQYIASQASSAAAYRDRLKQVRNARTEAQAAITRLLTLVESGAMEPDDPELKDRLDQLKLRRTELDRDIQSIQENLQADTATITPERIKVLSTQMRERLRSGPPDLRQA